MLKIKLIKQLKSHCGPASLEMVLNYYGIIKDQKKLGKICRTDMAIGTLAEKLVEAAKNLGLKAEVINFAELTDIEHYILKKKIPVIVRWFPGLQGHYSVAVDINKNKIFLADPEIPSIRKLDRKKFMKAWFDYLDFFPTTKSRFLVRQLIVVSK